MAKRKPATPPAAWPDAVALFAAFTKARDTQDAAGMRAALARLGPLLEAGEAQQAQATGTLTTKHARFVREYLVDLNATAAYRRAGYGAKDADSAGPRLLGNVGIAAAIAAGAARQLAEKELSASRVLEELRRLAFADLRSFFDAAGNLKPIASWTPEQGSQVASFEIVKKNLVAGDGQIDTVHKFKGWDKVRSLEMLAKHFKLLVERVEVTGGDDRVARLVAARKRVAK